jgi:hypothetical protein
VIRTGTLESAQASRRHLKLANGTGFWRSDLIVSAAGEEWMPQAFLVEQDPQSVILPHFHERDEFQIVVGGDGTFGRHAVRPVGVHYAGRHTGYGPITSGRQGLWYFSLRAVADPGARFLPEARSEMRKLPKRQLIAEPVQPAAIDALRALREGVVERIVQEPDGIAAWMLRVPPGGKLDPPAADDHVGARFYLVVEGEMRWQGERLPRLSTAFVSAEEASFALQAGDEGAEVLAVQFPFDSSNAKETP